jgi:aminoglycoside phosphotransferase (APT) family kinase protein
MDTRSPTEVGRRLLAHLRDRLDDAAIDYADPPSRLLGGNFTFVYRFRLSAVSSHDGPLVLRMLRGEADSRRVELDATIQNTLVAARYPAPRILWFCDDSSVLGAPFEIMECFAGTPLTHGYDEPEEVGGRGFVRQHLPQIRNMVFGDWPRTLAWLQARLHELDAAPLERALCDAGFEPGGLRLDARLDRIASEVEGLGLEGLRPAVDWLREHRPKDPDRLSVCHGDFFPNQVLAENGNVTGVIDWTDTCIAYPELDVGIVRAGIATVPAALPAPLLPLSVRLTRWLAQKSVDAYRTLRPLDPERLRHAEAIRCVFCLLTISRRRLMLAGAIPGEPRPDTYDHPLGDRRLSDHLHALTGVRARPVTPGR